MTGTLGISAETLHSRLYKKNILAPLSPAAAELLRIVSKPEKEIEVHELAKHVSVDPMLTAKVLRMANSPYYATLKRIETVRDLQKAIEEASEGGKVPLVITREGERIELTVAPGVLGLTLEEVEE